MALSEFIISDIGSIARNYLLSAETAIVKGNTSKGLFLSLPDSKVVFLSYEVYRSPLTLNLRNNYGLLETIEVGETIFVTPDSLRFPSIPIELSMRRSKIWQALPAPAETLSARDSQIRLKMVVERLVSDGAYLHANDLDLASWLPHQLGLMNPRQLKGIEGFNLVDQVERSIEEFDLQSLVTAIESLLGLGGGLTPAGDDLTLGLMLLLNRWNIRKWNQLEIEGINQAIVEKAFTKTTTISANLIECACQGQADERILAAGDGIVSGELDIDRCVSYLQSWGSSSGKDALVGIALGIGGKGLGPAN